MDNKTIVLMFNLICSAVQKLGYQVSHDKSSKLTTNSYISVYKTNYFTTLDKWVKFMEIHVDNDNIIFKNRYTSESKSIVPVDIETTNSFYRDFTKYTTSLVGFPDIYKYDQRQYDKPVDDFKFFNDQEFIDLVIPTESLLLSKTEHSVSKDSILILPRFHDNNWSKLEEYSKNITLFVGDRRFLFLFDNVGKYHIMANFENFDKINDFDLINRVTYTINVE